MSTMELKESSARYNESLIRAISRCKELAIALKEPLFFQWANSLEGIKQEGVRIANAKGRTKSQIETDINQFKTNLIKEETKH